MPSCVSAAYKTTGHTRSGWGDRGIVTAPAEMSRRVVQEKKVWAASNGNVVEDTKCAQEGAPLASDEGPAYSRRVGSLLAVMAPALIHIHIEMGQSGARPREQRVTSPIL